MANPSTTKHINSFINGIISDGNAFTAPENAVKDMLNMEIMEDGSLRRRRGLAFDDSPANWTNSSAVTDLWTTVYEWEAAGSDRDKNYAVIQRADTSFLFRKDQAGALSANYVTSFSNSFGADLIALTGATHEVSPVDVTNSDGILVHTNNAYVPSFTYMTGAATVNTTALSPYIRDYEGVDDGYAVDYNPVAHQVNCTFTTPPAVNELITGTTSGFQAYVLQVSTSPAYFTALCIDAAAFTNGEAFTGSGAGAGTINTVTTNDGLTKEHYYNLLNQGWNFTNIGVYGQNASTFPSNAQVWFAGKDASGNFSATELNKIDFGTSPAPKGREIIDPIGELKRFWEPIQTGWVYLNSSTVRTGMLTTTFFANRLILAGGDWGTGQERVYVSQLSVANTTDTSSENFTLNKFHSVNDPTAEYINDTLPTDGFTFDLKGAGRIVKAVATGSGVVFICKNGVWFMRGTEVGFTAQDNFVEKISNVGCNYAQSVVEAGERVYFWGDNDVYEITAVTGGAGTIQLIPISRGRITDTYRSLTSGTNSEKSGATGYYDKYREKVLWCYNSQEADWSSYGGTAAYFDKRKVMAFNIKNNAFSFYDLNTGSGDIITYPSTHLVSFTQEEGTLDTDGLPALQVAIFRKNSSTPHNLTWGLFNNRSFYDWGDDTAYFPSYFEAWPEHLGEPHLYKYVKYIHFFFNITEENMIDNGSGGAVPDFLSGALASIRRQWTDSDASNMWSSQTQVYDIPLPPAWIWPAIGNPLDFGYTVAGKRYAPDGKARSHAVRLDAEDGKDMHILGYSMRMEVVTE